MARTKDRGTNNAVSPFPYNVIRWKLGEYIRLSKEDLNRGKDESNSVINQRKLLDDYYQQHIDEFESVEEQYVDDGCTGTDTNREEFQRLIADIYARKVNCVIIKDLSRLSRNYYEAGELIESMFVKMNVRFISLAEGIDSYKNPDSVSSILVPITNCYQTSKKIRQVFDYKKRNGEFIGSYDFKALRGNEQTLRNYLHHLEEAGMVLYEPEHRRVYDYVFDTPPGEQMLGSEMYCSIMSVIETCKRKGMPLFDNIISIFRGKPAIF